jgi:hypothetical protein
MKRFLPILPALIEPFPISVTLHKRPLLLQGRTDPGNHLVHDKE